MQLMHSTDKSALKVEDAYIMSSSLCHLKAHILNKTVSFVNPNRWHTSSSVVCDVLHTAVTDTISCSCKLSKIWGDFYTRNTTCSKM